MNWSLLGHEWAVDLLSQHVAQGQVRHAYLLTGPQGVGRRTLALRLAQALNCPQPVSPGQPCLKCSTCQRIQKDGLHGPERGAGRAGGRDAEGGAGA